MSTAKDEERAKQIAEEILKKSKKKQDLSSINVARYGFLGIAFLQLLGVLLYHYLFFVPWSFMYWDIGLILFFSSMFVLSFWRPLIAFVVGLGAWLIVQIMLGMINIDLMLSGWILKVMILTALIMGLLASIRVPKPNGSEENAEILDLN